MRDRIPAGIEYFELYEIVTIWNDQAGDTRDNPSIFQVCVWTMQRIACFGCHRHIIPISQEVGSAPNLCPFPTRSKILTIAIHFPSVQLHSGPFSGGSYFNMGKSGNWIRYRET